MLQIKQHETGRGPNACPLCAFTQWTSRDWLWEFVIVVIFAFALLAALSVALPYYATSSTAPRWNRTAVLTDSGLFGSARANRFNGEPRIDV